MVVDKIISADEIIDIVSESMGVPVEDIKSSRRYRRNVDARKVAAHMMHTYTTLTTSHIALKLGMDYKRHDTVLYYLKDIISMLSQNKLISKHSEVIENKIIHKISNDLSVDAYDISDRLITKDKFVSMAMDAINWQEKGTTREALSVMYYNIFIKKQFKTK